MANTISNMFVQLGGGIGSADPCLQFKKLLNSSVCSFLLPFTCILRVRSFPVRVHHDHLLLQIPLSSSWPSATSVTDLLISLSRIFLFLHAASPAITHSKFAYRIFKNSSAKVLFSSAIQHLVWQILTELNTAASASAVQEIPVFPICFFNFFLYIYPFCLCKKFSSVSRSVNSRCLLLLMAYRRPVALWVLSLKGILGRPDGRSALKVQSGCCSAFKAWKNEDSGGHNAC